MVITFTQMANAQGLFTPVSPDQIESEYQPRVKALKQSVSFKKFAKSVN